MTLADFFGEQGLDWKTAMQEIAAERQFAADLGIIVGVERTEANFQAEQPETFAPEEFSQLDCGTGSGGFKPGNDCARGQAAGSDKKKDEDSQLPPFGKAKTIEEAEAIAKNFAKNVSYRGVSVDKANEINSELDDFFKNHPGAPKLYEIKARKFSGKFDEEAPAAYQDIGLTASNSGKLYINTAILGNDKKWQAHIQQIDAAKVTVDRGYANATPQLKQKIDFMRSFDRQVVDYSTQGIVRHEMGHHLDYQVLMKKDTIATRNEIAKSRESFQQSVSYRAAANSHEYIAESYVAYRKGASVDPKLKDLFNSKIKKQ
jgi:hypothetical protein